MALNLHKRFNMVRLEAKYGSSMNLTDVARMTNTSYPTAREWVEAWKADKFGLTLSDALFIAQEFGIIPKEEE